MVCPRVAAGMARGSTVRGPGGRGGSSFLPGSGCGCGYENPEANTVTCGFPVTVPCDCCVRLVLAERGLRRAPPGQVRLPDRFRRCGLMIEESGDHGAGLGYFLPAAAGQDRVVLGRADRHELPPHPSRCPMVGDPEFQSVRASNLPPRPYDVLLGPDVDAVPRLVF